MPTSITFDLTSPQPNALSYSFTQGGLTLDIATGLFNAADFSIYEYTPTMSITPEGLGALNPYNDLEVAFDGDGKKEVAVFAFSQTVRIVEIGFTPLPNRFNLTGTNTTFRLFQDGLVADGANTPIDYSDFANSLSLYGDLIGIGAQRIQDHFRITHITVELINAATAPDIFALTSVSPATTLDVLTNDQDIQAITSINTTGLVGQATIAAGGQGILYDTLGLFSTLANGATATQTLTYTVLGWDGVTRTETVTINITGMQSVINGDALRNNLQGTAFGDRIFGFGDNDTLNGNGGNDSIFGGDGADRAYGGTGNDVIYGEAGNDQMWGDDGNDSLFGADGADRIWGGAGADSMDGGLGNDQYWVDHAADIVTELAGAGTDRVTASVDYTLGANLEILTLTGAALVGTGNDLANTITGNAGANTLSGLNGNDRLVGLDGDDLLAGGANNDRLEGGNGNDTLIGGLGRDQLLGGAGADLFVFAEAGSSHNDRLNDFADGIDHIGIGLSGFGLTAAEFTAACFTLGTAATAAEHRFIYNQALGTLYFDADGVGGAGAALVTTVTAGIALGFDDLIAFG